LPPSSTAAAALVPDAASLRARARVDGKFLDLGGRRFLVKGVSYGTFAPNAAGEQFPDRARIGQDFARMAAAGLNTVRTYTLPPVWLLDLALAHGLRVIAGVPWPQHLAFIDDRAQAAGVRRTSADAARSLGSHPALLMLALGNEIPPEVVRWHGAHRIEQFLAELYADAKAASPESLFTYVNFPPTEYLDVACFDVCSFNVYLHREDELRAYLARVQHLAGSRPLLLAEAGADSLREGLDGQARLTAMHLRAAFAEGACGAVAFAWTDAWWRGGRTVDDWAFGLVDASREPKPALTAVQKAFASAPFSAEEQARWPRVSVVVCAFNAAETLDDCLSSIEALTYPHREIILVNDGSADRTGEIARRYEGVTVLDLPNGGLSAARNAGLSHATGDIVAYTDADVRVDPDWLTYLVQPFLSSDAAGSGGPNIVPPDDPWVAQSVARAPGSPTHVMLNDRRAEHVPGCNMAFRREALLAVGGFNPVYLRAGDDVDICWRLMAKGFQIGFAPSAVVWHHHRSSVRAYWRQQVGYGEGETWLAAHHPERFVNGEMLWRGHIYSAMPFTRALTARSVNTGTWGTAAFPSVYATDTNPLQFLPHSPVWMASATALLVAGAAGRLAGVPIAWPVLGLGLLGWGISLGRCALFAWRSNLDGLPSIGARSARQSRWLYRGLIAWLHLIQPIARLRGRIRGLASAPLDVASAHVTRLPWHMPAPTLVHAVAAARMFLGRTIERRFWSETWVSRPALLTELLGVLRASRPTQLVDVDDGWRPDRDLSLTIGRWGWLHVRTLVEVHDHGRCLLRVATRVRPSFLGVVRGGLLLAAVLGLDSAATALSLTHPALVLVVLAALAVGTARAAWRAARTVAVFDRALSRVTSDAALVPLGARATPATRAAGPKGFEAAPEG